MNNRLVQKSKRLLSGIVATAIATSMLPTLPAVAETGEKYPYTLFAGSSTEGAITVNAGNFCINGNVATNGTIVSSGNMNVNGTKTENAGFDMIYIFDKIDTKYFSGNNVEEHTEDYVLDELNININTPTEVLGEAELTGNININTALKAFEDVTLNGEVKNTNDSVIYSKYGDIVIDSTNVNLNGLVYAPFGSVEVKAMNLNLNNVVIIADSIVLDCPNVNANYSTNAADFVGTVSEPLNIPKDEWQYMKDENENGLPDFFEDFDNWSKLADTDGDGLPDSVEEYLGSDPDNTDTDGDGLNDYYEVFGTYTDPTKADSDENGVNDGDEDFDEDGLTNLEEFLNNTYPYIDDSDNDGLSDGDEVNKYGTDPLVADTDGDGLDDGDEITLGTNPLVQDTDGDGIIDSKEKFQQTYTHKVKNEDCAVTEVIVDMECTGNINKTTSVESVMNTDILCTDVVGLIGEPFEIETTSEFDTATLTFTIDKSKLGETEFANLMFLWYNEEENDFVELETTLDEENSTVSITTTHFSKYMVIDKYKWFEAWAVEFDYNPTGGASGAPTIPVKYNTVLAIDCSGSMDWNDPISIRSGINSAYDALHPYTCNRITAAEGFIKYMNSNDETAIVLFTDSANTASSMTTDKETLKLALQKMYSNGGTSFSAALNASIKQIESAEKISNGANKNRIILLSDGDDNDSASRRNAAIQMCNDKYIEVYTVGFGSANDTILQNIADKTGGKYYKALNAQDIVDIFAKFGYMDDFDMTDTDGDKLPDAVETAGIRLQNGNIIYTNPVKSDTDGDGLLDGEEIDPTPCVKVMLEFARDPSFVGPPAPKSVYYFKMYSDPTVDNSDSDYDGIEDSEETKAERLNSSFNVTWDSNGEIYNNITYSMNYSQFFGDNTKYNSKISTISSLMASLVYDNQILTDEPDETNENSYVDHFLLKHGMKDVVTYKLAEKYDDQHITDVVFGHHRVKYNGQIKEVIAVVIRGTNETVEEWSSNFDIGCDSIFDGNGLIPKNEDWKIKENHMGFDIAATRVIKLLDEYLSQAENLDQSAKKTLWITGHSRGAGIANIVGARLDEDYETFVYTFAAPMTTTISENVAKSHDSIFNVINSDDIIAEMPLSYWGFRHYGNDVSTSVAENYSNEWQSYTSKSYSSNQSKKKELLDSFALLATDRNDCYEFHCSCHGDGSDTHITYKNNDGTNAVIYGEKYQITDLIHGGIENYRHCETTAFFMQYLARLASSANEGFNAIPTALTFLAPKYGKTRFDFAAYSLSNIASPHQQVSYYLISNQ